MKKYLIVISCIMILSTTLCFALVFGGSNLGILGYPSFDKIKPVKPLYYEKFQHENYINEIKEYEQDLKEYLENAKNDIQRIQESMQTAIEEYNKIIAEANRDYTH